MKNTDTKERILELLFIFPTRKFHVREISRLIKISAPAISKSVKQLEKEDLIESKKKLTYEIWANLSNENFKNMKRIYNFKSIYSSGLFNYLSENFPLDTIIFFGSYSRGDDIEKSDIDIAIIGKEKKLDLEKFERILKRIINVEFINLKKISKELRNSIINGIILNGYIIE